MRGEHGFPKRLRSLGTGSPPHARGAQRDRLLAGLGGRITPACAGSTRSTGARGYIRSDHPRMRGEHGATSAAGWRATGSPPHARGARERDGRVVEDRRITPACAGSTVHYSRRQQAMRDHPRMRGEHDGSRSPKQAAVGSPPHARGAPRNELPSKPPQRITPACAGSTATSRRRTGDTWDHPRMRGEHTGCPTPRASTHGSPPHARGAHPLRSRQIQPAWITPACAGSTVTLAG